MITEDELYQIYKRWEESQKGPWKAYIEGRNHTSGSDFIMTGEETNRGNDIEMYGATVADYDFIAHAKQDIPRLLDEIQRLKNIINQQEKLI